MADRRTRRAAGHTKIATQGHPLLHKRSGGHPGLQTRHTLAQAMEAPLVKAKRVVRGGTKGHRGIL